jgi:hypothetical protein
MKTTSISTSLFVLIFLMFFGNVTACSVDPKWEQFMKTEKYNEALSYLDNNEKEIVHNYSQFCYDYFKAESYYKLGQLEKAYTIMKAAISLNPNSHKENPNENKKAVFYAIELAELYFSENNIDKSFEAADWATGRGNYDSKYYVNNKEIDATGRLAELMGDLWVKKGKNDYAKLYYNVLDLSKYSTEMKNKRALANGELTNYSIPQKTYTKPIITENTYSIASETQNKGECKEGDCINGYGSFVYPDGKTYTGYWKNGKREGKGYTYEKGMVINDGYWKNDEKITDGCISGDCKNGYGSYDNSGGITYNGQWKDGKRNGEGVERFQRYETDITTYIGQWVDGKKHGNGKLITTKYNDTYRKWENDTYEGKWEDGKFAEGKETQFDGSTYTGSFGSYGGFGPLGECTKTLTNGYYMKATYKKSGDYSKAKYYNNNDIEITKKEYIAVQYSLIRAIEAIPICISGNCQNGYGITKYQNGDRYFGYSVNGNKEGLGFIWYADKVTKEYVSLTSLATKTVTTPGGVTYGIWVNGIQTQSFNRENFYEILISNPYYGGLWGYDNLGARERAESAVLAQKEKEENDAALARYYNEKLKNVSFTSGASSGSSNSSSGNGTGDAKMPDIIYKTVGGSSTVIYTHKQ